MKILHRVVVYGGEMSVVEALRAYAIEIPEEELRGGRGVVLEIADDDPRWPAIAEIRGLRSILTRTEFSAKDLAESQYVTLLPDWMNGYPQPSDDFGFRAATYDLSNVCNNCGCGYRQIHPFRLSKPPKWGRRSIFVVNWVYDIFFVPPAVWESHFRPFGIPCRDVVLHRTGAVLDNVVQLDVQDVAELDMDDSRLRDVQVERCTACGRLRYNHITRGYQPRPLQHSNAAICKSAQYFGTGHRAEHLVYVSHALYAQISTLKGALFAACLPEFPAFRTTRGHNGAQRGETHSDK